MSTLRVEHIRTLRTMLADLADRQDTSGEAIRAAALAAALADGLLDIAVAGHTGPALTTGAVLEIVDHLDHLHRLLGDDIADARADYESIAGDPARDTEAARLEETAEDLATRRQRVNGIRRTLLELPVTHPDQIATTTYDI